MTNTQIEQRYEITVELTDGGKRVTWDGMGCYSTSPAAAAKEFLAGFKPRVKAVIKSIKDESGNVVA